MQKYKNYTYQNHNGVFLNKISLKNFSLEFHYSFKITRNLYNNIIYKINRLNKLLNLIYKNNIQKYTTRYKIKVIMKI